MDGISALTRAMQEVVAPKSPPRLSKDGAAVGLSFLDTSLRQNHVRRVTERIRCTEVGAAQRVVEVDISLNLLDRGQWAASRKLNDLRERSIDEQIRTQAPSASSHNLAPSSDNTLWVPIWRVPRRAVAPINVRDSTGTRLPRLTQYESSRLLASGMYRLLRSILRSRQVEASNDIDEFLYKSDKARWLVQSALIALFTEQSGVMGLSSPFEEDRDTSGLENQHDGSAGEFKLAREILERHAGDGYNELLDIALSEYILVVALPGHSDEHILAFDSPVNAKSIRTRLPTDTYVVRYEVTLPANLRAYHLVCEADNGVEISSMSAVSNADQMVASRLREDVAYLVKSMDRVRECQAFREYWWLEFVGMVERLSELLRRRTWEARAAQGWFVDDEYVAARGLVDRLDSFRDDASGWLDGKLDGVSSDLRHIEEELSAGSLGCSLSIENDPSSSTAHAYWRRIPSRAVETGRIQLVAMMSFADATDAKTDTVAKYAGAVSLVGLLVLAALNLGGTLRQIDAAVAILLLVPGFMYYRLELPRRNLVLARLQTFSRLVAHISLISMVGLSVVLLGSWSGGLATVTSIVLATVPMLGGIWLRLRQRRLVQQPGSVESLGRDLLRRSATVPDWFEWAGEPASGRRGSAIHRLRADLIIRSGEAPFNDCGSSAGMSYDH